MKMRSKMSQKWCEKWLLWMTLIHRVMLPFIPSLVLKSIRGCLGHCHHCWRCRCSTYIHVVFHFLGLAPEGLIFLPRGIFSCWCQISRVSYILSLCFLLSKGRALCQDPYHVCWGYSTYLYTSASWQFQCTTTTVIIFFLSWCCILGDIITVDAWRFWGNLDQKWSMQIRMGVASANVIWIFKKNSLILQVCHDLSCHYDVSKNNLVSCHYLPSPLYRFPLACMHIMV